MTISQTISTLPDAPQRSDAPATFVTKADAHVASLPTLVTQLNLFGTQANTTQTEINASQSSATASAAAAAASEAAAAASAATSDFVGTWSSLTGALNKPATVLHSGTYWRLLNNLADVTASEPTAVSSDWALALPRSVIPQTAAATLSVFAPNELQDGSAYVVPLANSVPANWYIDIEQPQAFAAFRPTLVRSGSDTFLDGVGADTSITFQSPVSIRLTSDGVSQWRL